MLSRIRPDKPRMPTCSRRLSMLEGLLLILALRFSQVYPLPSPCLETIPHKGSPSSQMASLTYPTLLLPRQRRLRCSLRQTVACSPVLIRRVTRSQQLLLTCCRGRQISFPAPWRVELEARRVTLCQVTVFLPWNLS